ncbi:insulin-like growth factor-binding protein complex acid labile subunit isoform X2 [Anoplophora glabripennis]|uniref:insulin-like growth factor-binding protein complex acid labile subunit isoform X2 n=1 Tax=Anoplophora glabripennis TaxID=217634 RepID=UPI00087374A2|nr:insulin-like growth factor-binding protein complex acid labile subunit isoform X2 [Anoplophora glabripennis]
MVFYCLTMSTLLLSILGLSAGLQHCPMWKQIAPCSCRLDTAKLTSISCEKMTSYDQVVGTLRGHFSPSDKVSLRLASSYLEDLQFRSLKELNVTLENLKLNHDSFGSLNADAFDGSSSVSYLSLADNTLEVVPEQLWKKMPNIQTLDLGRTKIKYISESNFKDLPVLNCLVLPGNQISRIDTNSFSPQLQRLHLGRNYIRDLNDSLLNLSELGWLFVNTNDLTTLDNQLPRTAPNLILIHASQNRIDKLPQQLKLYPLLESIFFQNNRLKSLDGILARLKYLRRAVLDHNQINTITEEDFIESDLMESLLLGHNEITSVNNSLLNLHNLNFLNLTYNLLTEFSFQDVVGLQELRSIDLSYNQITTLIGPAANLVEWNIKLTELKLDNNRLETLNGALAGLPELLRLNLSFNRLKKISPDDLIGLDQLRLLDVSHNHLTTLEETSKTFLPRLSELKASHNYLTILERDFHGLPVLCHADLSNNQIVALGRDLVAKTRCKIEHGVHEGTWDTLKIYLQDNPILCDAALPEIMSAMEINHTRIYGVSHCPPLSEQPVTSKPNAFLGYIPESTQIALSADPVQTLVLTQNGQNTPSNQHGTSFSYPEKIREPVVELRTSDQYTIENDQPTINVPVKIEKPVGLTLENTNNALRLTSSERQESNDNLTQNLQRKTGSNANNSSTRANDQTQITTNTQVFDPVQQGQQITKLASEIEELRSRIEKLSSQNELLLNQQFNKSSTTDQSSNLTTKPPNENLIEPRKP